MTSTNAPQLVRPLLAWFDDAKLGIFIHWTAAAIPAFATTRPPDFYSEFGSADFDWAHFFQSNPNAESYWNVMSIPGSPMATYHTEHYGDLPFEAFVEQFRAGLAAWDPEPWAELFARSGARYVVFVVKCEDGFLLWPSAHPNPYRENWQAERDVVGVLAAAVRARGMRFGVMYTGGMDWTFGGIPIADMDSMMAAGPDTEEYAAYADAHWRELVERYQPSVLWNDYSYTSKADPNSLYNWYVEQVPDGLMNDRFSEIASIGDTEEVVVFGEQFGDFATTEYACQRDLPAFAATQRAKGRKWENSRPVGSSWGYNRQESDATYLGSTELVQEIVDVVAHGGNFLLHVGPTGAGDIPWEQAERLVAIGWWLRTNGGAVYGTRPWDLPAATTDDKLEVRFTANDDAVHAIVLAGPSLSKSVAPRSLALPVELEGDAKVELLGHQGALAWESTDAGVRVTLPEAPTGSPAISLRMTPRSSVRPGPALRAANRLA
ncbi:MAG: alpha-L-fucosidase [Chloroflexi bacterium]|nr:alpha-L-fucosidase [Chloroflexota bacterium]